MIEKMYGAEIFYEDAANELIPGAYDKALEECAMTLSYVIVEDTGEIRCHNCSAEWTSPGCLLVRADENCVRMLHLNSEVPLDVHFVSGSRTFRASAGKGMSWIGGTRPFPSLSPLP